MVLGHGAGGQGWSVEIVALTEALTGDGWAVALVDQPWRVAGRRVATPPRALDAAWVPILASLTSGRAALPPPGRRRPQRRGPGGLSHGGRGGRQLGCSVPLVPAAPAGKPESSRAEELLRPVRAGLPVHVVQGERDPFGTPDEVRAVLPDPRSSARRRAHSFGRQPEDVVEAVREWLRRTHG